METIAQSADKRETEREGEAGTPTSGSATCAEDEECEGVAILTTNPRRVRSMSHVPRATRREYQPLDKQPVDEDVAPYTLGEIT